MKEMKKNVIILTAMVLTLMVYWYFSGDNLFTSPAKIYEPLVFKQERSLQQYGPCPEPDGPCFRVQLEYPVAFNGADTVRDWVNGFIHRSMVANLFPGEPPPDPDLPLDSLALGLADEYLDLLDESPDYVAPWSFEIKANIIFQSKEYLTLEVANYSYMGGAHPNAFRELHTLDLNDLKEPGIGELVADTTQLKELAEAAFRDERSLPPGSSLNAEGFYFPNDRFAFPANFGLTDKGLKFIYNPYEVAPYALGFTEFVVPYGK